MNNMNNMNKRIISEYIILSTAPQDSLHKAFANDGCSIYYHKMKDLYTFLGKRFTNVLGIQDMQDKNEIIEYLSKLEIDAKTEIQIKGIEEEPLFIKLMGEDAISKKYDLEKAIGIQINPAQLISGYKRNPEGFIRLSDELKRYKDMLGRLVITNIIPEEKYHEYIELLKYFFDYLMSIAKGEQEDYRKMSDYEFKALENNTPKHM